MCGYRIASLPTEEYGVDDAKCIPRNLGVNGPVNGSILKIF
jgi:hypothetical protein